MASQDFQDRENAGKKDRVRGVSSHSYRKEAGHAGEVKATSLEAAHRLIETG